MALSQLECDVAARDTGARWVGVSRWDGITDVAAAAAAATGGRSPSLLLVFASPSCDLHRVLGEIAAVAPAAPLVGCTTAGEITTAGPGDRGAVITALGGEDFSIATCLATDASSGLRQAGEEAAAALQQLDDRPHQLLLLLTDGLAGDQQEIVRGAYSVAGAQVPLVGGCAGDDSRMEQTHVFYGNRALTNAVVGVAIGSTTPFGVGVHHGWSRVGEAMLVTATEGSRVFSLDDQPALDVYLERLAAPENVRSDPAAFRTFAMTHPLGVSRRSGEEVRFIAGADFTERSLICIAQVPQGGLTWIMAGDQDSVLSATATACEASLAALGGANPIALLAFDCIARRGVLGDEGIAREVDRIADAAGGAPVAGFYTYGEIARTRGTGGFHNQTLVVLALG